MYICSTVAVAMARKYHHLQLSSYVSVIMKAT